MTKSDDRHQVWSDAAFQSWAAEDIDTQESLRTEDGTCLAIHPFDESETLRGRAAIRQVFDEWKVSDVQMLKNTILSSGPDFGIGNARARKER